MLAYLARLIMEQGYRGRVVVVYNHLGCTASGHPIEWPGTEQIARQTAESFGFEFVVRARNGGGLWERLLRRGMWPGAGLARWCTSELKTGPTMTWVTEAVAQLAVPDPPARASCTASGCAPRNPLAGKQVAQVLPDLGIGIHRRPRFKVGVTPSAQDEAIGTQFSHAAQPT